MIVVTFALPDESREFVRGLGELSGTAPTTGGVFPTYVGKVGTREVTVVHTGVAPAPAEQVVLDDVLRKQPGRPTTRLLIAAGYAGALRPGVRVGDLVLGGNRSDPALLAVAREALAGEPLHVGTLVTETAAVESAAAKATLHAATGGALAVDMETAWIAAACARTGDGGVPMLSLRAVSDAADQDFPVPGRVMFDQRRQRPRYLALPLWLAAHPARIAPFARFVRGLGSARARLAEALEKVIGQLDD